MKEWMADRIKRDGWPAGAWDAEKDKYQWIDEATGFDCLIVRNYGGALCGYVGIPPEHPYFEKGYTDIPHESAPCHGGITFADKCNPDEDESESICHTGDVACPVVWWLGFDCGHGCDYSPAYHDISVMKGGAYRDVPYVKEQVAGLAAALKEAA